MERRRFVVIRQVCGGVYFGCRRGGRNNGMLPTLKCNSKIQNIFGRE